jgi:diadenosine tetraphosphate (Ap4A) HIT family hydrolase
MNRAIDEWSKQQAGTDCYLCMPRISSNANLRKIASLSASSLHLIEDQRFLGHSTLIFDERHATSLEELSDDEYTRFSQDLRLSMRSIRLALRPDHMNVALLGNSCPHLHWGIIPRYRSDPAWGKPIWEHTTSEEFRLKPETLSEAAYAELISGILTQLEAATTSALPGAIKGSGRRPFSP